MITKIKDKNKMRRFISSEAEPINDENFNNWLDYLNEFSEYVEETYQNNDGKIIEKGNLTLTIGDNEYDTTVEFIRTIENDEIVYIVDLDYNESIEEI